MRHLLRSNVSATAQLACLLEASAPKPGNVSPGRNFADLRYEDFLASAAAIGEPLAGAGTRPLGETIRCAIAATAHWTRSNSNLGIVLLLGPLVRAACISAPVPSSTTPKGVSPMDLRAALGRVLNETTVEDARDVYAAIRSAGPGGLGRVAVQDVADEPNVTLLEAMELAADRDGVAKEYATGFQVTFESGAAILADARRDGLGWDDAIAETFLTLLAMAVDTHIARRSGTAVARKVSKQAASVLAAGGVRSNAGRRAIDAMARSLCTDENVVGSNATNPGTTADLTAAAIFVVLLDGGWSP